MPAPRAGPFFLRDWLPADDAERDQALIGAIGASDPLQLDGVGGGSTLNSKVAIVSRSAEPGCDLDYLFAQVGVGQRSVDTRPNCGNMLSGVLPFAIEQGLIEAAEGTTTATVFNVNTRSRIEVTVRTPGRRIAYDGEARIDGVAGTAAPILLNFLDAWGAVTGQVFPTGRRIDVIDGIELSCIDAAMPLMIVRAADLGVAGSEMPGRAGCQRCAAANGWRRCAARPARLMGLGDVSNSVIPKPVLVSAGDAPNSITSRYFTPRRCHASHAVTGAIGVASAFALPGTVASSGDGLRRPARPGGAAPGRAHRCRGRDRRPRRRRADQARLAGAHRAQDFPGRAAPARLRFFTFHRSTEGDDMKHLIAPALAAALAATAPAAMAFPTKTITIVVPTAAGGGNDAMARTIAQKLGPLLGQTVIVDNRAGANGSIASEYVARATPDGHTLMLGYIATHSMNPALQKLRYDPVADFEPIGLVGYSPTLMVAYPNVPVKDVKDLIAQLKAKPDKYTYASAGNGTAPHFAAELFKLKAGVVMLGIPYKGSAPAVTDTIGGQAQFMFPSLFTALPFVKTGKLRPMAVAGPKRVPELPDVPTLKEAGVDGVDVTQWYAMFAPAKTPKAIVDQINKALNQVLSDKEIVKRIEDHGADVQTSTPDELRSLVAKELVRWKGVVQQAKLTAD